jgi:cell pole-organizing protein PopZ
MPDQTAPEPSMDEILASIRRIISEDEAPENPPRPRSEGERLLLTERASSALPSVDAPAPGRGAPSAAPTQQPPAGARPEHGLVGEATAASAASSLGRLSTAVDTSVSDRAHLVMPPAGRSLEDVARELLRPMLKTWLDQHLASIVQARVDEEVERISRGRVR